jgi:hypothetical protein
MRRARQSTSVSTSGKSPIFIADRSTKKESVPGSIEEAERSDVGAGLAAQLQELERTVRSSEYLTLVVCLAQRVPSRASVALSSLSKPCASFGRDIRTSDQAPAELRRFLVAGDVVAAQVPHHCSRAAIASRRARRSSAARRWRPRRWPWRRARLDRLRRSRACREVRILLEQLGVAARLMRKLRARAHASPSWRRATCWPVQRSGSATLGDLASAGMVAPAHDRIRVGLGGSLLA